jgi:hypothetical protein
MAVWRRWSTLPLLPLLNLVVAAGVLAYWAGKWYGYVFKHITWYATDQLLPLCAIGVCCLSGATLAGKYSGTWPHWCVFGVDMLVLLAAALFFSLFNMDRLM